MTGPAQGGVHTVEVETNGQKNQVKAKNVMLATGSEAKLLPGLKADETILTNVEILSLSAPPKSLIVIGAGAVGVEFASIFRSFGTEVTILEFLPRRAERRSHRQRAIPMDQREFKQLHHHRSSESSRRPMVQRKPLHGQRQQCSPQQRNRNRVAGRRLDVWEIPATGASPTPRFRSAGTSRDPSPSLNDKPM